MNKGSVPDHVHQNRVGGGPDSPMFDAYTLLGALALWPARMALAVASFDLVSGVVLIEGALWGWAQVPFACSHVPSSETMRWRWPLYLVALTGMGMLATTGVIVSEDTDLFTRTVRSSQAMRIQSLDKFLQSL